jgi:hypothetical protein
MCTADLEDLLRQAIRAALDTAAVAVRGCAEARSSCQAPFADAVRSHVVRHPHVIIRDEGDPSRFTFSFDGQPVSLFVRAFPTNYGRAGTPITQHIQGVLDALRVPGGEPARFVAWLAYPIPDPVPDRWLEHLAKVRRASARTERVSKLVVGPAGHAHAYLSRA